MSTYIFSVKSMLSLSKEDVSFFQKDDFIFATYSKGETIPLSYFNLLSSIAANMELQEIPSGISEDTWVYILIGKSLSQEKQSLYVVSDNLELKKLNNSSLLSDDSKIYISKKIKDILTQRPADSTAEELHEDKKANSSTSSSNQQEVTTKRPYTKRKEVTPTISEEEELLESKPQEKISLSKTSKKEVSAILDSLSDGIINASDYLDKVILAIYNATDIIGLETLLCVHINRTEGKEVYELIKPQYEKLAKLIK